MIDPQQIEKNFDIYCSLIEKLGKRAEAAENLVTHFGERLATAPAAQQTKYAGAYLGGLVDINLKILQNANRLVKEFGFEVKSSSLILCCLFHNLGCVGTKDMNLYRDQDNDWRRNNLGELFAFNDDISFMTIADRTRHLVQEFGIQLDEDEYLAMTLSNWDNRRYHWKEPPLAFVVYAAARITSFQKVD